MPVNHVRRHQRHDQVVDLGRRRTERVHALLALRGHLARAHAAYEAHGLEEDAVMVFIEMCQIESEIRTIAPRVYTDRWPEWAERDAELMHTADQRHPECTICKLSEAGERRRAS